MLETKVISSLGKIYPEEILNAGTVPKSTLANEPFSFQLAYRLSESTTQTEPIYTKIESDLPDECISVYKEGYLPIYNPRIDWYPDIVDKNEAGLFPDPLFKRKTNSNVIPTYFNTGSITIEEDEKHTLVATKASYQGLWFTVNEDCAEIPVGKHHITIKFYESRKNIYVTEETVEFEVLDARLDEQKLIYTNWFHCDCLADIYKVEMFSERHFEIIRSFVTAAAKNGMNMILLPAFTPPLDTVIDGERLTAQLVRVKKASGKYELDFTLFEKFVNLCLECGIKFFEHSHLFTQWGAKHTPKIIAEVDGKEQRIFGWETDSKSEEYKDFLKAYFAELVPVLEKLGIKDKIYFHTSDEPEDVHYESYRHACDTLKEIYPEAITFDALSKYKFFEDGAVDVPVVMTTSEDMPKFVENCPHFWCYYIGSCLADGASNRLISLPSGRNRRLGIQLYSAGAKGFLHWGYNFYYDILSNGLYNPFENPCNFSAMPGTSYIVYPAANGTAVPSIRMKVMFEAINDYNALITLEHLIGREKTMALVNDVCGEITTTTAISDENIFALRTRVNEMILQNK